MTFTKDLITELAQGCDQPLGITILDALYDAYNEGDPNSGDEADYYRFLYKLSQKFPGLSMVELGCKYGAASLHFLMGGGAHSTMIDVGNRVRFKLFMEFGCDFVFINDRSTNPSVVASVHFQPDVILVDSSHAYNETVGEIYYWLPKLRPGGLMLFDDVQAEEYHKRPDFGCGTAFKELIADGNGFYLNELHPGGWGFGAYLKPQ